MPRFIHIHKATPSPDEIDPCVILIGQEIPEFVELRYQDNFCEQEASELETALYSALPGATYDRLLGQMLQRKSTHFRVKHSD